MRTFFGRSRGVFAGVLFAFVTSLASSSQAAASKNVERFEVKVANSPVNAGAARVLTGASTSTLRSVVTDFASYPKFIRQFTQARVLGRSPAGTDVYLEVPILKGASKVWAIVRFAPAETKGDEEVIRGKLVKGNVKRLDATWRIKKVDETSSNLTLELLIVPELPMPNSFITTELRKAAGKAVGGARNEAERRTAKLASSR